MTCNSNHYEIELRSSWLWQSVRLISFERCVEVIGSHKSNFCGEPVSPSFL